MPKVIITVGVPASGKSTWAEAYVNAHPRTIIVCRDDLRAMQGCMPIGTPDQEKVITKIQNGMIEIALAEGKDCVVSNTNINKQHRKNLIKFAHEHLADVEVKVFDVPLEECIRRNTMRSRVVGGDIIRKMYDSMQAQVRAGAIKDEVIPCPRWGPYRHEYVADRRNAIVVDLDGTIAGHNRSPYDYSKVSTDYPIQDVIDVVNVLSDLYTVLFVSGRPDSCREDTEGWLDENTYAPMFRNGYELHMRKAGDQRPDFIIKNEIYDAEIIPRYNVVMAFDDRSQVVRHIRNRGITVAQVAAGRF